MQLLFDWSVLITAICILYGLKHSPYRDVSCFVSHEMHACHLAEMYTNILLGMGRRVAMMLLISSRADR